jgi:hypothetical protein
MPTPFIFIRFAAEAHRPMDGKAIAPMATWHSSLLGMRRTANLMLSPTCPKRTAQRSILTRPLLPSNLMIIAWQFHRMCCCNFTIAVSPQRFTYIQPLDLTSLSLFRFPIFVLFFTLPCMYVLRTLKYKKCMQSTTYTKISWGNYY